jgi:hypothetical protein
VLLNDDDVEDDEDDDDGGDWLHFVSPFLQACPSVIV